LKNVAEQISAIEESRNITAPILAKYLTEQRTTSAPSLIGSAQMDDMGTERELLYKVLFDMRNDINDLKRMIMEMRMGMMPAQPMERKDVIGLLPGNSQSFTEDYAESEEVFDEPKELTKADVQREQIIRALRRHNGRRKEAAAELFMSERTLYRKIKELGIE
jgi:DNA-binding NtrC family response regulator